MRAEGPIWWTAAVVILRAAHVVDRIHVVQDSSPRILLHAEPVIVRGAHVVDPHVDVQY